MKELLNTGVSLNLEYCAEIDGLIGCIKNYSVAVRENNETGSYGILLWVKKGEFDAITTVRDYLADRVTSDPETVKNFRVQERGVAVALRKIEDPYKNARTIKHFLADLTGILSVNFYRSCCHKCGKTEELGIYLDNGVPSQYCSVCGEGKEILKVIPEVNGAEAPSVDESIKKEEIAEPVSLSAEAETAETAETADTAETAVVEETAETAEDTEAETVQYKEKTEEMPAVDVPVKSEEKRDDISVLIAAGDYSKPPENFKPAAEIPAQKETHDDINVLLAAGDYSKPPEMPKPAVDASAQGTETYEDINKLLAEKDYSKPVEEQMPAVEIPAQSEESNDDINELLAAEGDSVAEEEMPAVEIPAQSEEPDEEVNALLATEKDSVTEEQMPAVEVPAQSEEPDEEVNALLATEEDSAVEEQMPAVEAPENTDISSLMMGGEEEKKDEYVPPRSELFERMEREYLEEQKNASRVEEDNDYSEFMVTPLDYTGTKDDEIKVVETNNEAVGHSDEVAVTEIRDDSNDGEDIDVTEIESTVNKPTETTGHEQLTALETPLDEDGNVPLMNPNSESDDNIPSPVDGPDAIRPSVSTKPMPRVVEVDEPREIPPGYAEPISNPREEIQKINEQPRPYTAPAYVAPINWGTPKSNPVMGIIGALVFAAIAVAAWVFIARIEYISFLGSIVLVAGVYGGYRLASGSIGKTGKVICTVLSVLFSVAGYLAALVINVQINIHEIFGYNISFLNAIEWAAKEYCGNIFVLIYGAASLLIAVIAAIITNTKIAK